VENEESINMHLWEGRIYKDDRIFILDLTLAKKSGKPVWAVVTRRNCEGFPPFRIDDFKTKEEAIGYIQKIEPTTPLISLGGKSPESPLPYENYCDKLKEIGVPSAMEIYELNKNVKREIVIEEVKEEKIVCVLAITGPLKGHKFFAKSDCPIIIGRGNEAAIKIDFDNFCSRKHAIIYWERNQCFIEDLNSTNGTFVNNERIYGKKELCNKDLIGLGDTELVVSISDYQKESIEEKPLQKYAPEGSYSDGRAKMEGKIGVGDFIGDDYDVCQVLEGGMGIVYICYNNKNKKMYALKTIKKYDIFNNETIQKANMPAKEMFKQEARNWINLEKHPHIVRAYTVQRFFAEMSYPSKLYIIMEYVPADAKGRNTLTHYFKQLTFIDILKIAVQFCFGMEYAYSKGIEAHRDIKPDNIMITPDMIVKITDFGLSRSFQMIDVEDDMVLGDMASSLCVFRSASGVICGTPPYMAPEQFNGYADKRSDIYSFGVVLYQLATGGALPFIGKTPNEYENMHKHENIPYLKSPLFPIIKKCLEKDPNKRYKDFSIIKEDLQELHLKQAGEKVVPPQIEELGYLDWINKGYGLDALHKYEEAIACFDKALEIDPRGVSAWGLKAQALLGLQKYEEAILCYDKVLDINPGLPDVLNAKGELLSRGGKYYEAIACFDKALEINPNHDGAWFGKKSVLYELGKYDEAIVWYDKVINANPNNIDAWWDKANALSNLGRHKEAIACFDNALKIKPGWSEILADKGKTLSKLGKYDEAIACFDTAIEADPEYVSLYIDKSIILIDANRYKDAMLCCDKALEINPECGDALYYKTVSLFKMNEFKEALECVEKVLNLDPLQIPKESHRLKQQILQNQRIKLNLL
jgi:tetratricopeptide (TPR) repeat protein